MAFLSDAEKQKITEAIRDVESQTSSELVTVIAEASDDYYYIPTLWATIIALFVPTLLYIVGLFDGSDILIMAQLGSFIVLSLLFQWSGLKYKLIPKAVKYRRAARTAREQFFEQNLHLTQDRTGLLIFVSVGERYVEFLADAGINEKVAPEYWNIGVEGFLKSVKSGKAANGFVEAIKYCGTTLIEHFPATTDNKNELPDHLIEI